MTGDAAAKPQRADTVRSVQGESQGSIEGNARSDAQVPLRSSAAQPCRSLFLGSRRSSSARQPFLCVSLFALFISSPLSLSRLETAKARFADRKGLVDSRGGPTVPVFLSSLPCLLAPPRGWAPPPPPAASMDQTVRLFSSLSPMEFCFCLAGLTEGSCRVSVCLVYGKFP